MILNTSIFKMAALVGLTRFWWLYAWFLSLQNRNAEETLPDALAQVNMRLVQLQISQAQKEPSKTTGAPLEFG